MTKLIAIVSAVIMLALGLTMPAEPAAETPADELVVDMAGVVLDVTDTYYLIQQQGGGNVQVNYYDSTIFEGKTPEAGDLIHIVFSGMMTRSLPPQINAERIGCYIRTGNVVELTETGFTLDDGMEIIEVHADAELLQSLESGAHVTVYFNGAMTMSLPAQIGAEMILVTTTIAD